MFVSVNVTFDRDDAVTRPAQTPDLGPVQPR